MNKLLLSVLTVALLVAPLELSARHAVKHHAATAQTRTSPQPLAANPNCAFGATPPAGTTCSISDYTVGGALSSTDALAVCQVAGGCFATSPTITYHQEPMSSFMTFVRSQLSLPSASLLNSNGTTIGSVALGTNLSLSGTYPNQTLNATAGGSLPSIANGHIIGNATGATATAGDTALVAGAGISITAASGAITVAATSGGSGTVGSGTGPAIAQYITGTSTSVGPESVSAAFSNPQGGPLDLATQSVTAGAYTNSNVTVNTKGIVTAISSGSSGGGASPIWTGTVVGSGTYTSTTVQGGWQNLANTYRVFQGIIATTNTGAATLSLDSQAALPIQVQNAGGTPLATIGGELPPGIYNFQLDGTATHFIRLNTPAGHITRNPASPHAVTPAEWANLETFVFDSAAACVSANTCTLTLPDATTVSTQTGINLGSSAGNITLALANAGDGINGAPVNTPGIVSPNTATFVITSQAHGINAYAVPPGKPSALDMTWLPGQNMAVASGVTLKDSYGSAHYVIAIKCAVDAPTGGSGAATIEFRYAPSGTAISGAGSTLISTAAAFNANGTAATEVSVPMSSNPINIPVGNRIGYVAAGTGWSTAGGGSGGISAGAGNCSLTVL